MTALDRAYTDIARANNLNDARRAKITRERIDRAIALRKANKAFSDSVRPAITRPTHVVDALTAATAVAALGKRVRVKFPDGPRGSVYVRVGHGQAATTVRFADHEAPRDHRGQVRGGYSKTLRREHRPAAYSYAAKGDRTLEGNLAAAIEMLVNA